MAAKQGPSLIFYMQNRTQCILLVSVMPAGARVASIDAIQNWRTALAKWQDGHNGLALRRVGHTQHMACCGPSELCSAGHPTTCVSWHRMNMLTSWNGKRSHGIAN
jgi:hypothetical protein